MAGGMETDDGRLTPAERALREAAGPTSLEFGAVEEMAGGAAVAVDPDDWRLYHLMRNLPSADRLRVLAFAELLFNLRHAMDQAQPTDEDVVTDIR